MENYKPENLKKIKESLKKQIQESNLFVPVKVGIFRRFWNWFASIFSSNYSTIYTLDEIIDKVLVLKNRLNLHQISIAMENVAIYSKKENK